MSDEFKFRALTSEDWKGIVDEALSDEEGLRLKSDKIAGTYISEPIDSGMDGCRWHYAVFDVDIPANSTFTVSFCSSEKEEAAKSWSGPIPLRATKYALVPALPGRYITVKIDFHRVESEESPVLRQVKLYYPRLSYLQYLPAVYQEESASKEFLERFLSIFEHALYDSEETISRIPMYFDPMAAPDEFVPWLARWLSLDLYELLGEKNREFILRAVEFYKQKGTVSGIASIVSFLTGKKCCVKEYMNNVFRSYGMEHEGEGIVDISECRENIEKTAENIICTKFHRETSKTVDTAKPDLLANMGKYCDEVHYVTETSKDGRYSPHLIGLFIFLDAGDKLVIEEEGLRKIINTFLPVFVRAEIITVEGPFKEEYDISGIIDEYKDTIHSFLKEEFKDVGGVYKDNVNWNWLYTNTVEGRTNDLLYRTPHSKIGVELTL
jgi:phage tail-like protein